MERNNRNVPEPWSMRQTVVYHRFKAKSWFSTWIVIAASQRTTTCLDRYVKSNTSIATLSPFEVHLMILDSVLANWRPYLVSLTARIAEQVRVKLVAAY